VPIGLSIRLGCWPKFPYKKYPKRLPGKKYKINNVANEK
jgi:hypothetical protein